MGTAARKDIDLVHLKKSLEKAENAWRVRKNYGGTRRSDLRGCAVVGVVAGNSIEFKVDTRLQNRTVIGLMSRLCGAGLFGAAASEAALGAFTKN
jgi:hypothetical protein